MEKCTRNKLQVEAAVMLLLLLALGFFVIQAQCISDERINVPKGLCYKRGTQLPACTYLCYCCFDDQQCYQTDDDCHRHCPAYVTPKN
uniref:Embryo surrounding factor 1 brassicaceae domain-containing protein n=1 Tax=Leersia perrieri TaxID=77586 RepID=A0A0D9VDZ0_9ORYZ